MVVPYNKEPLEIVETRNRSISIFDTAGENIDAQVVNAFGEEWLKFQRYSDVISAPLPLCILIF